MNSRALPLLAVPPQLAAAIAETCVIHEAVGYLEELVLADRIEMLPIFFSEKWRDFRTEVCQTFDENDYAVLRGIPSVEDGAALLVAALTVGESLRTYRDGRVVKYFKMSPWTTELSHTTRQGEFHTDLNTEPSPPAITAIQCLESDPGSPRYGNTRVARLPDLLDFVERDHDKNTRRFLMEETVTMLNERSSSSWSGRIVDGGTVRYHPETIRAAVRKSGDSQQDIEQGIAGVERAANSVTKPFVLQRADVLLLSNRRTLHCRSECSVVFRKYPTEFYSRRVSVLHAHRERHRA